MALKRVWIPSPNYSSRGGARVRLIVLHTAEGARTYDSLGNFFASSSVQASSQVGTDDTPNTIGEYVSRANKSWTQSEFNPVATSNELCGFASWSRSEWLNNHHTMLENCAKWIAEEAAYFGIPIVKLSSGEAQGSGRGVCQHVDLGIRGGGHHDCGSGFPMDDVLAMARSGGGVVTAPGPIRQEDENMIASALAPNGSYHVFVAVDERVYVTWDDPKTRKWNAPKAGYMAGYQWFAPAPKGHKITAIDASVARGILHVFIRTEDGASWVTWQGAGNKWNGGTKGFHAGFMHFGPPQTGA